jgi:DNA-binding NtrC family response regulator
MIDTAQFQNTQPACSPSEDATPRVDFVAEGHVRRLADIEADIIRLAVQSYGNSMSDVARRLGISRSTLYRRLDMLGLL